MEFLTKVERVFKNSPKKKMQHTQYSVLIYNDFTVNQLDCVSFRFIFVKHFLINNQVN